VFQPAKVNPCRASVPCPRTVYVVPDAWGDEVGTLPVVIPFWVTAPTISAFALYEIVNGLACAGATIETDPRTTSAKVTITLVKEL
jgi:hypothetical protein